MLKPFPHPPSLDVGYFSLPSQTQLKVVPILLLLPPSYAPLPSAALIRLSTTPVHPGLYQGLPRPGSKPSLAEQLRPALEGRPHTVIVLAQNGVMIEDDVAVAFPQNPVLSGVVYCPAVQTGPGEIEYKEMLNLLEIGTFPSEALPAHKEAAHRFADLMVCGGGGAEVHDDIQIARWSKLLMNAARKPIGALTLTSDGDFLTTSDPYARDLSWGVMMELVELAAAAGVEGVTVEVAEGKFSIAKKRAETGTGREMSMLQDVRQGRSFEVEAILGNNVSPAKQKGIPTPRSAGHVVRADKRQARGIK